MGAFYYLYLSGGIANVVLESATNSSRLSGAMLQKFNTYKEIGMSYNGTITGNVILQNGDPYIYAVFNISMEKYYNDTRITFTMQHSMLLTGVSSLSAVIISEDNGSTVYACYDENNTGYACNATGGSALYALKHLTRIFGITGFSNTTISNVAPSLYDGQACWRVNGTTTINSKFLDGLLGAKPDTSFYACISPTYYTPLSLEVFMTGNQSTSLFINMYNLTVTNATSEAQVTTLP